MTQSHSNRFYKKTISSHFLNLQKENGLVSTQWAFRPKGFLDKKGRSWSRDALSSEVKDFDHFWSMRRKNQQKIALLPIAPKFAQRKLIDLTNYLPSSSPCGLLTVTHRIFKNFEFYGESRGIFVSRFCEECKLLSTNVNQIQVKQTILKDFGG